VENTNEDFNEDASDHSEKGKVLAWTKCGGGLMGVVLVVVVVVVGLADCRHRCSRDPPQKENEDWHQ